MNYKKMIRELVSLGYKNNFGFWGLCPGICMVDLNEIEKSGGECLGANVERVNGVLVWRIFPDADLWDKHKERLVENIMLLKKEREDKE